MRIVSILLILLVLVLFTCFAIANHLYKKSAAYKNEQIDIKDFLENRDKIGKIACTGSTYSKFAYGSMESLRISHRDFTLQAESLEMDYRILIENIGKISKDGIVFITVASCCFLYDGNKDNPLYSLILTNRGNPYSSIKGAFNLTLPVFVHPRKAGKLIRKADEYKNIYDSVPVVISEDHSKDTMKRYADGWIKMFSLKDLKTPKLSDANKNEIEKNCKHLEDMIELCLKNDLHPVIVVPPFSDRMNQYFSLDFTRTLVDVNVTRVIGNRNIPFLNYQWDDAFQKEYSLFVDGGFRLNKMGSEVFIRRLLRDLNSFGLCITNKDYFEGILDVQ